MEAALKIIISRSPAAMSEAIKTLQAIRAGSPILQLRYNRTVEMALDDPQANFTKQERGILAAYVELPEREERMDAVIKVRMTEIERLELEQAASREGISLSELIRRRLKTSENSI